MTRKGAQVGPSLEWTGGLMLQDIYWDKLNCELNVICEAFELFNWFFYFVHVHMWGGCKSRLFTNIKPDTPINVYTRFCLNTAKSKFSLVSPVADW